MRVLSILLTNCLEASVDTADCMHARGYGLKKRSSYSIYRFTASDLIFTVTTPVLGIFLVVMILFGIADVSYYPVIELPSGSILTYLLYGGLTVFTGISILLEVKDNILWRYLRSKI